MNPKIRIPSTEFGSTDCRRWPPQAPIGTAATQAVPLNLIQFVASSVCIPAPPRPQPLFLIFTVVNTYGAVRTCTFSNVTPLSTSPCPGGPVSATVFVRISSMREYVDFLRNRCHFISVNCLRHTASDKRDKNNCQPSCYFVGHIDTSSLDC